MITADATVTADSMLPVSGTSFVLITISDAPVVALTISDFEPSG